VPQLVGLRSCPAGAPTVEDTFAIERARVVSLARADRGECPPGRRGLAVFVVAPAGDGSVGFHAAGVLPARADRGEGNSCRGSRRGARRSASGSASSGTYWRSICPRCGLRFRPRRNGMGCTGRSDYGRQKQDSLTDESCGHVVRTIQPCGCSEAREIFPVSTRR